MNLMRSRYFHSYFKKICWSHIKMKKEFWIIFKRHRLIYFRSTLHSFLPYSAGQLENLNRHTCTHMHMHAHIQWRANMAKWTITMSRSEQDQNWERWGQNLRLHFVLNVCWIKKRFLSDPAALLMALWGQKDKCCSPGTASELAIISYKRD